jgi:DNA replication protein DnaC
MIESIKDEVYLILKARREIAENKVLENERILEKDKEYIQLRNNLSSITISLAQLESGYVNSTAKKISELKLEKKKAKDKLSEYLKSKGLNLEIKYHCPKCLDTGLIKKEQNIYCPCFKLELSKLLLLSANIDDIKKYTLDVNALKKETKIQNKDDLAKVYKALKDVADDFPNTNRKNLFIAGATGTGKTHALKALARHIIDKGFYVFYTTAFNMNETFRKYHLFSSEEKDGLLDNFLKSDLLIIDDLGSEIVFNNVTLEYLYLVLNERLEKGLHTFISSNLLMEEIIERYGERIFSRIFSDNIVGRIEFKGKDIKEKVKKD